MSTPKKLWCLVYAILLLSIYTAFNYLLFKIYKFTILNNIQFLHRRAVIGVKHQDTFTIGCGILATKITKIRFLAIIN